MITELKAGTTYKLIDKDGWLAMSSINKGLYVSHYFTSEGLVTINEIFEGDGYINDVCIINESEYKFFEEVEDLEEVVTQDTTTTLSKSIYILGDEWLVVAQHPTQEAMVICVRVKDNCVDVFSSSFVDEKLNPKSWQEQLCENMKDPTSVIYKGDGIIELNGLFLEEDLIEMAKHIIELTEGV